MAPKAVQPNPFYIIFLGIVKIVSFTTIQCNSQWWPPGNTIGGFINSSLFLFFSGLTVLNFLTSIYDGPGYLPLGWMPEDNNTKYLQFCNLCLGYKAPRSHHCKKCKYIFSITQI